MSKFEDFVKTIFSAPLFPDTIEFLCVSLDMKQGNNEN